jgi:hypothetical protein
MSRDLARRKVLSKFATGSLARPASRPSVTSVARPRDVDVTGAQITECSTRPIWSLVITRTGRSLSAATSAIQTSPLRATGWYAAMSCRWATVPWPISITSPSTCASGASPRRGKVLGRSRASSASALFRRLSSVNEHDGIEWLNKERFEETIDALAHTGARRGVTYARLPNAPATASIASPRCSRSRLATQLRPRTDARADRPPRRDGD